MFKERAMKLHSVSSAPPICFVSCSRKQIFMAGQFHVLRSVLQVLQIVQSSLKSWISLFSKSFKSKPENQIFGSVLVACRCLMCFPLACKQFRWFSLFSISEAAMLSRFLHFLNFWVHQTKMTCDSLFISPCNRQSLELLGHLLWLIEARVIGKEKRKQTVFIKKRQRALAKIRSGQNG